MIGSKSNGTYFELTSICCEPSF